MLKEEHYAHERRAKNRDTQRKKERLQSQEVISKFLSFEQLQQAQQSEGIPDLFNQVTHHLNQHKFSHSLKSTFYQHFRKQIIQYNRANDTDLPLPT